MDVIGGRHVRDERSSFAGCLLSGFGEVGYIGRAALDLGGPPLPWAAGVLALLENATNAEELVFHP